MDYLYEISRQMYSRIIRQKEDFDLIPRNLQKVTLIIKTCLMKTKTLNRWKVNQCYNKMITFPRPTRPSGIKVVSLKRRKINRNEM